MFDYSIQLKYLNKTKPFTKKTLTVLFC